MSSNSVMKQTAINAPYRFSVFQKVAMCALFQRDAGAETRLSWSDYAACYPQFVLSSA